MQKFMVVAAVLVAAISSSNDVRAAAHGVSYVARARTATWVPLLPRDIEHAMGAKVVSLLSRDARVRLVKLARDARTGRLAEPGTAWVLFIEGEIFEDSSSFSVTLALRPAYDSSRPSFAASASRSLAGQNKRGIYQRVVQAAEDAARRLQRSALPHLEKGGKGAAAKGSSQSLFDWGRIRPPKGRVSLADLRRFEDRRVARQERVYAGMRVAHLAYENKEVRHAFERATLSDPSPIIREYALKFLGPASRSNAFTQRVVLQVLREDGEPKVRSVAFDLSRAFVGLSLEQTLQTWVELLATKDAEFSARDLQTVSKLLKVRADAPNLDSALTRCLMQEAVLRRGDRRKADCLGIVQALPSRRRARILQSYLEQPLARFGSRLDGYSLFSRAAQSGLGDGCSDRALQRILLKHLSQARGKAVRSILDALGKSEPSPAMVIAYGKMVQEGRDRGHRSAAFSALRKVSYWREPPWAVGAWDAALSVAKDLANAAKRSDARRVTRFVQAMEKRIRKNPHRAGLRAHLDAEGQPKTGAVSYLTRCVLERGANAGRAGIKKSRDCAQALGWIARISPQLRGQALAALSALAFQRRKTLPGRVLSTLRHEVKMVESAYGGKARMRRCWRMR